MKNSVLYPYQENLYINLTNRCPARCCFCIKYKWSYRFRGHNLKLSSEPSASEIIKLLKETPHLEKYKEVVFCGYGEPFLRLETMKRVAEWLKKNKNKVYIRVDTIGYANLIYKRNVLPEIKNLVDAISVSLNAENEEKYLSLCQPKYGPGTYSAVLDFIAQCKKYIPRVTVTAVAMSGVDLKKCSEIAQSLGADFRSRPCLVKYEEK